jgi:hypothetical protein
MIFWYGVEVKIFVPVLLRNFVCIFINEIGL